jgi:hypothetical protein
VRVIGATPPELARTTSTNAWRAAITSAAQRRELVVVDREQVLGAPAIEHLVAGLAQHGVAGLQHALVVLRGGEVVRPQVEHAAIEKPTAVAGRAARQRQVLRREHDDVEPAEVARQRPHRLAIERDLARARRELELVAPDQIVLDHPRSSASRIWRRTR